MIKFSQFLKEDFASSIFCEANSNKYEIDGMVFYPADTENGEPLYYHSKHLGFKSDFNPEKSTNIVQWFKKRRAWFSVDDSGEMYFINANAIDKSNQGRTLHPVSVDEITYLSPINIDGIKKHRTAIESVFDSGGFKDVECELYKPSEKFTVLKTGKRQRISDYNIYKITKYKNNDVSSKNLTFLDADATSNSSLFRKKLLSKDEDDKKYIEKFLNSDYSNLDDKYETAWKKFRDDETYGKYDNVSFSKDDIETREKLANIIKAYETPYKVNDSGSTITFPTIDKQVDAPPEKINEIIESDEYRNLFDENNILKEDDEFEDEEDDFDEENSKLKKVCDQKEFDVAKNINMLMNRENKNNSGDKHVRYYALRHGGGAHSDVIVVKDHLEFNGKGNSENIEVADNGKPIKVDDTESLLHPKENDEYFFVETKLNYEDASFFKFVVNVVFRKGDSIDISFERAKTGRIHEINDDLYAKITNELKQDRTLRPYFLEVKRNIDDFVFKLGEIEPLKKRFGDILQSTEDIQREFRFPQDLEKFARIFNFYILSWSRKLLAFKESYIYQKLTSPEDTKQLESIKDVVENLKEKIHTLTGSVKPTTTTLENILQMGYIEKTNSIYKFITNKSSFVDTKYIKDRKETKPLYELIRRYYADEKDVRYIEIADEVFELVPNDKTVHKGKTKKGNVSGVNPLGLDVADFDSLSQSKHRILMTPYTYKNSDNKLMSKRMKLQIFIENPNKNMNNSFEKIADRININKVPFFWNSKVGGANGR